MGLGEYVSAQSAALINSTEGCWSGGIAGHRGCNYTFAIDVTALHTDPAPDTLWIGDQPVRLLLKAGQAGQANMKVTPTGKGFRYQINAGTSFDDQNWHSPVPPGDKGPEAKPKPPVAYSGVALFCYTSRGKRCYFVVTKIMKRYPPVSYP